MVTVHLKDGGLVQRATSTVFGGGYQGEGAKTVMPAKAGAKFSFRLVPNQDAEAISKSVEAMFRKMCPPGIKMELVNIHAGNGVVVPLESPFIEAAENAIDKGVWHQTCVYTGGGLDSYRIDFEGKTWCRYPVAGMGIGR